MGIDLPRGISNDYTNHNRISIFTKIYYEGNCRRCRKGLNRWKRTDK